MKVFYLIMVAFPYFQLILSNSNVSDTSENVTKENNTWTMKSVVIPLLDVGVLWAEDRLVRSKRNPTKLSKQNSIKLMNRIMQQTKESKQTDSSDAFVDSLVSLMSKSDPGLLMKLQKRIEEFERYRPRNSRNFKQQNQRPLIQFFNVTKISLSSDDEDVLPSLQKGFKPAITPDPTLIATPHSVPLIEKKINQEYDPEEDDSELNPKPDVTTLLKTKDGKIAKIQRSPDKKRYMLEIDYTTKSPSEGENENEDFQTDRKKRKITIQNQPSETERYMGYLQGVVGSSSHDTSVKHSFPLHKGHKIYSLT